MAPHSGRAVLAAPCLKALVMDLRAWVWLYASTLTTATRIGMAALVRTPAASQLAVGLAQPLLVQRAPADGTSPREDQVRLAVTAASSPSPARTLLSTDLSNCA